MPPRGKILAVDDHPTNLELLEDILGEDYDLKTAETGEEALKMVEEFQPALILLDIMMPGIDGYEVCRRIRKSSAVPHAKIIMVSAKALVSERLNGYEAGADDYLIKPFDEDELLAKVRVFLKLKTVEEVDQLKSDMLSLFTDETSNPLKGIAMASETLMSDDDIGTEARKQLARVVSCSNKRLQSLFEKVAELSKLKSGKSVFEPAPTVLSDVVREAIGELATRAAARNITIKEEFDLDPTVLLDRDGMKRVVMALVDNGIWFSPPGGNITIRVSCRDEDAYLMVTDHGEGIESGLLTHVFDEFSNVGTSSGTEGHGLSLAISRQIVQQHDGSISVKSTKNEGTTFTVRLPVASRSAAGSENDCSPEAEVAMEGERTVSKS